MSDRTTALSVLYGVLVTYSKLLAPIAPFIAEEIYKNLTNDLSVHLTTFPQSDKTLLEKELLEDMKILRKLVETGHAKRKEENIKLRQPLASLKYSGKDLSKELQQILAEELNVKRVEFDQNLKGDEIVLDTKITEELAQEGQARDLIRQIQQLRKEGNFTLVDKTKIIVDSWPKDFEKLILSNTSSISIEKGEKLQIIKVETDESALN